MWRGRRWWAIGPAGPATGRGARGRAWSGAALVVLGSAATVCGARPLAVAVAVATTRTPVSPDSFPSPPVLRNESSTRGRVELTLVAEPGRLSLRPGTTSGVWAYNGTVPGPTLEVHEGDHVVVHFLNRLPETSGIHWHGMHLPADMDGGPMQPVPAGGTYDYVFTVPVGTAGTYWYHPHPDARTGHQIARGLYGALIVRPAHDPLPASIAERLLVLSDNRLGADGELDFPEPLSPRGQADEVNGREGDLLLVNGRAAPTISIRSGEVQRWRVINASASRVYRLAIPGHTLLHVGSDGGLFERPVAVPEIVVASSERVEILVRGEGPPGTSTTLQALPYDRYVPQTRPASWNVARDLLTLRTSGGPPAAPVALPATLRPVPALDTALVTATRVVSLSQGMINGRTMDMTRADVTAPLGATEIWQVENLVGMDHPFHLHGFRFQVLDRDGVPEPYRSWKDVVNVRRHETVRLVVRYDDFAGRWMFHCHILDHEDHGMMGVLDVH